MDGAGRRSDVTGTADPGGIGRLRPGPLARISHDPDALEAFYTEHVTAVTRFVARLLAELRQVVAERAAAALPAAETHSAVPGPSAPNPAAPNPAARRQAGPGRPHRRLAITGAVSAAGAASLAVVLTVTLSGSGGQLADPAAPRFVAATTVAAVLNNAALAAQREPAVPPPPGPIRLRQGVRRIRHFGRHPQSPGRPRRPACSSPRGGLDGVLDFGVRVPQGPHDDDRPQ